MILTFKHDPDSVRGEPACHITGSRVISVETYSLHRDTHTTHRLLNTATKVVIKRVTETVGRYKEE